MYSKELSSSNRYILLLGLLIYGAVLILNDGFMALDEYWVGITRYIPAQASSFLNLVGPDDVKSPLQLLPMHLLSQLSLYLGVESPYWQYRFVLTFLGAISFLVLTYSFVKLAVESRLSSVEKNILFLLLFFYFAAPFALTRPMFEAVAAPWLLLSCVYAYLYDRNQRSSDLIKGVLFVSVAFVLRPQLGICALVFIALPLFHRKYSHFYIAGGLGLLFFILAGLPDYFVRGGFHFSLLQLTIYNYKHGSEYGQQGFWYYPALIFVIFLIPFFLLRYPKGFLSEIYRKYRAFCWFIILFVFLHSLFPNKWERFLISIIPLVLVLLAPLLTYMYINYNRYKLRFVSLVGLNLFLFSIASFFPAQKNIIEMSRYLNDHPEIKTVYRFNNTPEWITDAFILNRQYHFVDLASLDQLPAVHNNCDQALVVGQKDVEILKSITQNLKLLAVFNVNLIEQLAYKLNPNKNARRVQLKLYSYCQ